MPRQVTTELLLIRHAPALSAGKMAGRRDVDADCSATRAFAALGTVVGGYDHLIISPALRCAQTTAGLWPDQPNPTTDPRLWEQDFGAWEGMPYADLPDLGTLDGAALAQHRPPNGESFADLCARAAPALTEIAALGGRVAIVAHAGIVRAALALALGNVACGLTFQIAPLSLTSITALPGGSWSIGQVNRAFL